MRTQWRKEPSGAETVTPLPPQPPQPAVPPLVPAIPGPNSREKFNNELLLADAADRLLRLSGFRLLVQQFLSILARKCIHARRHWMATGAAVLFTLVGYFTAALKDYHSGIHSSSITCDPCPSNEK